MLAWRGAGITVRSARSLRCGRPCARQGRECRRTTASRREPMQIEFLICGCEHYRPWGVVCRTLVRPTRTSHGRGRGMQGDAACQVGWAPIRWQEQEPCWEGCFGPMGTRLIADRRRPQQPPTLPSPSIPAGLQLWSLADPSQRGVPGNTAELCLCEPQANRAGARACQPRTRGQALCGADIGGGRRSVVRRVCQ